MFGRSGTDDGCACTTAVEGDRLVVDASDCDGDGLAADPKCRETVIRTIGDATVSTVTVEECGLERAYEGTSAALLLAAGQFAAEVAYHDEHLAKRARRDPLGAAFDATARPPPVGTLVAETGLAEVAAATDDYDVALSPYIGPTIARERIQLPQPDTATTTYSLDTDAVVHRYDSDGLPTYAVVPVEATFDPPALSALAEAYDRYATADPDDAGGSQSRAVRAVTTAGSIDASIDALVTALEKHTTGYGVLEDLFADPAVSDVYATAPVTAGPLRAVVDGETVRTNVRLTADGADAFASRLRATSGRAFSRAEPTLDASTTIGGQRVRIAGVTDPVSDGVGFAFRANGTNPLTLPALVENGTIPARAAGLLSTAVRRSAATLVAGARSAGKTTTLGSLLWELDAATRIIAVEDTPELPVEPLRAAGRDVQPLHTTLGDGPGISPADALRTALRLGESAIVLGEVRGEEAAVLYESMRVGAGGSAVLGTIHGDGGAAVYERVVADLGVDPGAFAATDLVVTMESYETPSGRERRLAAIEEVIAHGDGVSFEPLFSVADTEDAAATGRLDRGNSRLLAELSRPTESYDQLRTRIDRRGERIAQLADRGITDAAAVAAAYEDTAPGAETLEGTP